MRTMSLSRSLPTLGCRPGEPAGSFEDVVASAPWSAWPGHAVLWVILGPRCPAARAGPRGSQQAELKHQLEKQ